MILVEECIGSLIHIIYSSHLVEPHIVWLIVTVLCIVVLRLVGWAVYFGGHRKIPMILFDSKDTFDSKQARHEKAGTRYPCYRAADIPRPVHK